MGPEIKMWAMPHPSPILKLAPIKQSCAILDENINVSDAFSYCFIAPFAVFNKTVTRGVRVVIIRFHLWYFNAVARGVEMLCPAQI